MKNLSFSQQGKREYQEDYSYYNQQGLYIICDGEGSTARGGDEASKMVAHTIRGMVEHKGFLPTNEAAIAQLVKIAQAAIKDRILEQPQLEGISTTLCMIFFHNRGATIAHMGNSRVYYIKPSIGKYWQSKDHSLVQQLFDNDLLDREEEMETHPMRSRITRSLQGHQEEGADKADVIVIDHLEPGDLFFLCTDGVLEAYSKQELVNILNDQTLSIKERFRMIQNDCQEQAGDNNTCILIELEAQDAISVGQNTAITNWRYAPKKETPELETAETPTPPLITPPIVETPTPQKEELIWDIKSPPPVQEAPPQSSFVNQANEIPPLAQAATRQKKSGWLKYLVLALAAVFLGSYFLCAPMFNRNASEEAESAIDITDVEDSEEAEENYDTEDSELEYTEAENEMDDEEDTTDTDETDDLEEEVAALDELTASTDNEDTFDATDDGDTFGERALDSYDNNEEESNESEGYNEETTESVSSYSANSSANTAGDSSTDLISSLKSKYKRVGVPSNGMIAVSNGHRWGYVNTNGTLIIPHMFINANNFSQGRASVQVNWQGKENKWIYINKKGQNAYTPETFFDFAGTFSNYKAKIIKDNLNYYFNIDGSMEYR